MNEIGYIMIAAGICIFFSISWYMIQKVHLEVLNLKSFICDEVIKYIQKEIERNDDIMRKNTPNEIRRALGYPPIRKETNITPEEWSERFDHQMENPDKLTGPPEEPDAIIRYVDNKPVISNANEEKHIEHINEAIKFCGKEKHPYA